MVCNINKNKIKGTSDNMFYFILGSITTWTYKEWNEKIQKNFETHFWIPEKNSSQMQVEPHPELINRRCIYKDTVGASNKWGDYQLRCNYAVAMAVVSLIVLKMYFSFLIYQIFCTYIRHQRCLTQIMQD